jgi:protein-tyrosine-phosphatase
MRSDHRVRELVQLVHEPYNLVSYHLKQLKVAELVGERRSSRDARDVYYSLDLDCLRGAYFAMGESLHPALGAGFGTPAAVLDASAPKPRVLILCTHNRARSQMAEGFLRFISNGSVDVFSAGNEPTTIHPLAIKTLASIGIDISGQKSKSMNDFLDQKFDYAITVCDSIRETCPIFPGDPSRIHWSFPDPAAVTDPAERKHAFEQTGLQLMTRMRFLMTLIQREHSGVDL